jgi:uncharacterized membrane protein SpoIIM required for sporulation
MKQEHFVTLYETEWQTWERWLGSVEHKARPALAEPQALEFPAAYRRLCYHLALARSRGYSRAITDRLQRIVQQGHRVLYLPGALNWPSIARFLIAEFPRLVRAQWRYMIVAAILLYLPATVSLGLLWWHPGWAHSVFGSHQLAEFEDMYNRTNPRIGRSSGTDVEMFGFYILNNVSIAFRTFASGLIFGVGSIYVLLLNGVMIGGVAGYLTAIGDGGPFWRFVVAHSAFELTAFVIAGGAGLRLGLTLLAPGRQRRGPALVAAAWPGAQLALGAFAMLVAAAFIEAFWSSIAVLPDAVKYGSAAALWALVLFWLGRGGTAARDGDDDGA